MNNGELTEEEKRELADSLLQLRIQHRQIDNEISALQNLGAVDMLKIVRMKKIKLKIKDKIAAIEDQLTPDIIA